MSDFDPDDPFIGTPFQTSSPTSLAGAISASRRAPSQQRMAYDLLAALPRLSTEGVWLELRLFHPSVKEGTIRARVIELVQAGLVEVDGEITNTSGEQAEAYRVCAPWPANGVVRRGAGPLALANAEIARLRARVTELEAQLGHRPLTASGPGLARTEPITWRYVEVEDLIHER